MNITYLKQVQENSIINNFKNRGFSLEKIKEIEKNFNKGKEFPKAFREFLFLAGDFSNFGFDDIDGVLELQKMVKEELEWCNHKIERPFFAFSVYDSQYSVIFLDETADDPKVYLISPFLAKGGSEPLVKIPTRGFKENYTFTELVNESIRRVKNNIAF